MTVRAKVMRAKTRRKLLTKAYGSAWPVAADKIHGLLKRRYSVVGRELRRANLRKRLAKTVPTVRDMGLIPNLDGLQLTLAVQKHAINRALFKAGPDPVDPGGDWQAWIDAFGTGIEQALVPYATQAYGIESVYFGDRGARPAPVDPARIIANYQARTGKQIKDIGQDTQDAVLDRIADWYSTDAGLPDLIDSLGDLFDESRAETIARTEASYVASQISLDMMDQFGVTKWAWDLSDEPCDDCIALAQGGPYEPGDPMPPDASHPRCLCGILYLNDDGGELMYGVDD